MVTYQLNIGEHSIAIIQSTLFVALIGTYAKHEVFK